MSRILVVEDNPENLHYVTYVLEHQGHSVSTAVDGEDGLAQAVAGSYDLILLDLQMPKIDGFDVLQRLQSCGRQFPPVVAVTAFAMAGDRERALAAGFHDYLTKPLRPQDLIDAVGRLVAR